MPNITAAELHALRDAAVAQQSSSGGSNRGSAPAGYTSGNAGKTRVLNPDSSAFAANAKDRHNETQRPWYKAGVESYQNADNSAHAQKEKDNHVTDNILYHQWEQQQKGLKADSSAHAQAEKDDEADKNPLFHQWKTAFDRQQEEKATQNQAKINGLQKELDELDANSAYITTSDQYDEYQNRRTEIVDEMVSLGGDGKGSGERALSNAWNKTKDFFKGTGSRTTEGFSSAQAAEYNRLLGELDELDANANAPADIVNNERERSRILSRLYELDAQAGREERTYDSRERVGAFFKSWGTGTGASYTNAAGNVNEITTSAQGMEREIAELEAQAARAQTAYDEAVQQYGEAGATFEKNLLIEAQQRLEARKAQYAGMEKERAYDAKAQDVSQKLYDTADRLLTQSEQEMAKAKYGASGFGSFALDAAKTGLDVAADTALSAVGVPGLANMAVRVYGSEAQQARLQGDNAQTAAAKGLKSALIEVVTEKIAGPFEKAYGKTALSSTINKAVDKLNASGLLKWAADTAGEGFEESMSNVLNTVADHMMGWDSGENSVLGDIAANKDEIVYDMLLGAFVGAFGATGNAIGTSVNTSPTAQAQTQVEQAAPVQTAPTQAETTQQAAANNAPSQLNIDNGSARAYNNTNVNVANNTGGMTDVAGRSVEADSGRVSGVYRGRDTIHRGEEKSSGAGVGSGLVLLSPQAKDTLAKRGVAVVETQDVSNDKPAFSAALDAARANDSVNGWAVTPKSVAELEESGAKLIMSANGTTGLAIAPDGDIEAVFANKAAGAPKGATKTTIPQAIANGGTKLDCYGDGLVTLYSQYGFVPVARVKFNPEYANQGWDASKGTPDIFFMMHNGDSADTVVQKMGTYKYPTDAELNALPVMDYDEAYSYRDSKLATRKPTDAVQPTGDISTPPTAQNVKQGDSGALNNAVNYNSRETQKNTAPTQETGNGGSLIQRVKNLLSGANTTEKRSDAISNMDFGEISAAIESGMVSRDELPFATVSNTTPQVLIEKAGAQNLPIIMDYSNVYLSTKKSGDLKGHYHDLGSDVMAEIPKMLESPVLMVRLRNGRINEIIQLNDKKGNPVLVSLELSAIKNLGGSFNAYNLVVTAFGAKSNYINNLVSNPDNTVIINNLPGETSQVNPQRNELPGVINEATSGSYTTSATTTGVITDNSANTFTSETAESAASGDTTSERYAAEKDGFSQADVMSVSDDISSDTSIPTDTQSVKQNFEGEETKYRSNLGKGNGTRTTQIVETINNADITTDAQREQLSPYVKNGKFDYIPDTNKAQTKRAAKAIEKNGWEASRRDFHDAVIQGKSSADLVAQGAVLMNNASARNASASEYLDLANDYIELLHRAGETLQAGKILQKLTPEGRLYCMQKTVKQINKSLTKGQRKTIAKAQEGSNYKNIDIDDIYTNYEVKLDESLVDEYINAETDEQRDTVISQIQQNIADQIPSTFVDKWNALRYVNMLGNFKTQERNLLGNTAMLVTQTAKNRVKAAAEVTANLFRAEDNQIERTASFLVGRELRKEAAADFENIKDIARGEGKYNDSQSYTNDIKNKRRIFNSELLEKYRKVTNWAMDAGDVIFLKANYADALGGWLKAHGISSIEDATPEQLDRGRAYAIKEAQEATFRDDNIVSKNVAKIGRNPVTEGIIPFRKTPANVAVRALEYSPIGIAETIYKGVQTKRGNANANEVINSLSKNILGTGLAMAGYALAKAGFARGSEDDDDLDMFQKMQGKQDYAVKIGDEWISLSQLAPNSVPLYMGVMLYEALDGGGLTWDNAYQILGCLNDPLMDMSMLSGVNDALSDVVTYGDDGTILWKELGNAILSYLTQGINNTLIGQAEQAWEKNRQTVYSDKDSILPSNVQYKLGKTLGKIPGVDYHQQDYIDAWGRTQSNGEPSKRIIDALLNPFYTSKDSTAEVDAELERLYKAGKNVDGFPNVLPQKASRSMEYVKGRAMTPDEYKQYSIDRGQKSLELVSGFMNSAEYDNLSDQQRAEVISDLYSLAAQQAINKVKAANGLNETTMNKYKGVSDENMPEYLAARQVFSDAALDKDGTDYSAVDAMVENFNSYSPEVQQKLMSDGYNVTDLVYADKLGQDAATYYGCKAAIEKNADKLGGTDAAKAISVYNYMHNMGKSDAEVLAAAKAQLKPDAGGQQNATIRRMEAYMTAASKNNYDANLGEWLNLVAELHDADENESISKDDVYAAWSNSGLGEKETYAGITRDDFYNIVKSNESYAKDEKYATQIDDVYAVLVPAQEKTKYQLAGSVTDFTNSENAQGQTGSAAQYTSPIDFLLANTPYAAYK